MDSLQYHVIDIHESVVAILIHTAVMNIPSTVMCVEHISDEPI